MCKLNLLNIRLPFKACILAIAGLFAFMLPEREALAQTCGNALAATPVIFPISGSKVVVGQTITITRVGLNSGDPGNCLFRSGEGFLLIPNGTVTKVVTNLNLNPPGGPPTPGTFINCFGTNSVAPEGSCLAFSTTYVVNFADVGQTHSIILPARGQLSVPQTITFPGVANEVVFGAAADVDGFNPADPASPTGFATGSGSQFLIVVRPGITITKQCDTNCFAFGAPISFHGTICNSGNVTMVNVAVIDTPNATITFAATTSSGNAFNPATGLTNGECVNYSGSYTPTANLCGPFPDTIVVTAVASGVFGNPTFSATNSATCEVCTTPCISVTKLCSTNLVFLCNSNPGSIGFSGIVINCGTVPLTNVVFTDALTG